MVTKICKQCGEEFSVRNYRKDSATYCNRACKDAALRLSIVEGNEKWCTRCSHFVPLSDFGKDNLCKPCQRQYNRDYRQSRAVELKAKKRQRYLRTKEQTLQSNKLYREENKAMTRNAQKRSRQDNPERWAAYKHAYYERAKEKIKQRVREYAQANRDKVQEQRRKYYYENLEKFKSHRRLRRARMKGAGQRCTLVQWLDKLAFYGYRCYLCRESLEGQQIHMEHRKPLARGGTNWIANIAPACSSCNLRKGIKTEAEFRALRMA